MATLDDVAAVMRDRFTESARTGAPVTISADEWNTLARAIYLRDRLEEVVANPTPDAITRAQSELSRADVRRR